MIQRALNQKTLKPLSFPAYLEVARNMGCVGVEARNDLGRPFFDGIAPAAAGQAIRDHGLRLLGLSEVYGFNVWNDERTAQIGALIGVAVASGAETISLIPSVDDRPVRDLRAVLRDIRDLLAGRPVLPLIEPIGFETSTLRKKAELVEAIEAVGGGFKLVHDTFQHAIAGETAVFATHTGMVHISGLSVPGVPLDAAQDGHRGLVDEGDRCANLSQIEMLLAGGYAGGFSFECTEPSLWTLPDLQNRIVASFSWIEGQFAR